MKPTVYYIGQAAVVNRGEYQVALLIAVKDHPLLGDEVNIRTSRIVVPPDRNGCFETLNTVYKPVEFSMNNEEFITPVEVNNGN